jgi:hypothetical protein
LNFLRQHFEKLVLGTVLAALVASIVLVILSMGKARHTVEDELEMAKTSLKSGKNLEPIPSLDIGPLNDAIGSPDNLFGFMVGTDGPKGGLFAPADYLTCVSPSCNYLIAGNERVCPFCRSPQPPEKKDVYPKEEDFDQDGLPDYVEKNTPFLKEDDPTDAGQDYDGDTFTNLEEYRNDTNMAMTADTPYLANNLRLFDAPFHAKLPIMLQSVQLNDAPGDPSKWYLTIRFPNSRGVLANQITQVGRTIQFPFRRKMYGPFQITAARMEQRQGADGPKDVAVVTMTMDEKTYTLIQGEQAEDPDLSANLVFLAVRWKDPRVGPLLRSRYRLGPAKGETFTLRPMNGTRQEMYEVTEVTEQSVTVRLVQGGGTMMDGGMEGAMMNPNRMAAGPMMDENGMPGTMREPEPIEFTITKPLDLEADLIERPKQSTRTPGGMPGMMPGGQMPGMRR